MSAFPFESPRKGDHPNHFKHDHNMFDVIQGDGVMSSSATPVKFSSTPRTATYASPGVASSIVHDGSSASNNAQFKARGPVLLPYNGYGNGNDQVREAMAWPADETGTTLNPPKASGSGDPNAVAGLPSALLSQNRRPQRNVHRGHLQSSDIFSSFDYPSSK